MILRLAITLSLLAPCVRSQAPHSSVPGIRGLDAKTRGLVLLGELGCARCHDAGAHTARIHTRAAPDLSAVGARVDPKYIAAFLTDPQRGKPGTMMPSVLSHLTAVERRRAAAALTAFLVSLGKRRFEPTAPDRIAARRGRALFHTIGCVACHAARDDHGEEKAIEMADSIPLGRLEHKYSIASLTAFFDDPIAVRASGRMPRFALSPRESTDLANYLLKRVRVPARLNYTLYLGAMYQGLDRLAGKEHKTGVIDGLDLQPFAAHGDFAVKFEGFVDVTTAGKYTFEFACDSGGRLRIAGGQPVSIRAGGTRRITVELTAKRQPIEVTYLHIRGPRRLTLSWSGPRSPQRAIPAAAFTAQIEPLVPRTPMSLDQSLVARGKTLFGQLGCVRCHALPGIPSGPKPPAMKDLDPAKGCLAKSGAGPRYSLQPGQVKDLRATLTDLGFVRTDEQEIRAYLGTFNCVACHARGEFGGISESRDAHFQSIGEDLGPSSRIPPPLTGVGAKLKPKWLANTLAFGQSIRPAMKTRMPGFGAANTARLAALFAATDTLPAVEFAALPKNRKLADAVRNIGQQLAGDKGMNCIACHQFAGRSSSTMISVDLVENTTERLQPNWFYHYLLNPVRFRKGTIMPLFFPGGVSTRKDIAGGDTKKQIEALWRYLERGRNVRAPRGLARPSMEIAVGQETVMLRRSVQNTGKRGISVGFPEHVSYTFDAQTIALNQIWWGRFVDASGVWSGQGSGQVRILERERATLPKGPAFAVLKDRTSPWPTATRRELGYQFRGYRLDAARRPTFEYECEGVTIQDAPIAVRSDLGKTPLLRRTFTLRSDLPKILFFRAALNKEISEVSLGVLRIGQQLELRIPAGTFTVRTLRIEDKPMKEVIVEIAVARGRSAFVLEYAKPERRK